MISLNNRIKAFESLGKLLIEIGDNQLQKENHNEILDRLEQSVTDAVNYNGWFIEDNVRYMLTSIGESLTKTNLEAWIKPYKQELTKSTSSITVGVVMAGNIPIVGFHDFLSVLISGNKIQAKLSSDDNKLLPLIANLLISIEPAFEEMISFTTSQLQNFDAIIATGSNNTSRYFEYYFGTYPNIIRKSRNGIAVITGKESAKELKQLTDDIFMYYGLGCRNVSHIMIPVDYDFTTLLDTISSNEKVSLNHKYFNNYEYNKAIYLVNGSQHFDTGNLLLIEENSFASPVSVISYEYYSDIKVANRLLEENSSKIQCIVSISKEIKNVIPPGASQHPKLWDYADGIDTMQFLINNQ
jgi:hypothetical protein